ncbi:chromosome replication/partitioning protein (plasmid) [Borrelia miyamotoi]|uniref:Chromosome replication/partitioning protein n=2 Tax=Borrelia miyamotoi TaxID=47466 RepID=A0AAQ3CNV6_9SPIR|nr:chromosome replication/partitioning protein [Borrelia miyamotoi]ATQ15607.1 chromosome replication/partitioning protein [Borrelia miyamotoi]ATQ16757.1 chromosome replication/partitioning protein [Borrelia miyamotoi]ATQ18004.1 chromosome replication/partitioning protein [Borrelia miyamotoi]ATQ19253.1 chromosome replication/partitioning protein [Borrelia miyamotoi]ATQ20515.1 chromosome replication/partitioning protein [Borrelia miyamotoi]
MKIDILNTIKSRVGSSIQVGASSDKERAKLRYSQLKEEIRARTLNEAINKVELAKALYEIKKNKLYRFDGYDNFYGFCLNYKFSRTMIYRYIKIGAYLEKDSISEQDVIHSSLNKIINDIRVKGSDSEYKPVIIRFNLEDKEKQLVLVKNKKRLEKFLLKYLLDNWESFITYNN